MNLKKLFKAYAELPNVKCKGKCANACTVIPVMPIERRLIKSKLGYDPFPTLPDAVESLNKNECPKCPLLKDNRCTIYHDRPYICRIYGLTEGLRCPYGCVPDKWFSDEKAQKVFKKFHVKKTLPA